MKNILKTFYKYKMSIIFFILLSFIISFFCSEYIYNYNYSYYTITFEASNPKNLFTELYFNNTINIIDEYNNNLLEGQKKISYANIDYIAMLNDGWLEHNEDNYTYYVKHKYFPSINRTSNGIVNEGENRVYNYFKLILSYADDSYNLDSSTLVISTYGQVNSYIVSLMTSSFILFIYLIILSVLSIYNKNYETVNISDNKEIYSTPFHISYWKKALKVFKNVKSLATISVLFALMIVCKFITLPSGFGTLGISFTYLIFSVISMIYGPICGIIIGALSDIIGELMFPSVTGFFIGYTLSSMLAGFTYGIFFYKTKITFAKCLYARIIVNLFINVMLGTIWWSIIYNLSFDATITYLLTMALPKNIIYLFPQSILLFLVLKYVLKPLRAFNVVDNKIIDNVSIL